MTDIKASQLNLRDAEGEMVPLSNWTFGDFFANLVAGGLNIVDGYYLTLTKENNVLTLIATGMESKTPYVLATSNQAVDSNTTYTLSISGNRVTLKGSDNTESSIDITTADGNTTYELSYNNNILTLIGSDGSEQNIPIISGSATDKNTEYTLTLDTNTNELVFHSTDEEVQDTRISINTGNYLDNKDFLAALMN